MVVADATTLLHLFRPNAGTPVDSDGKPVRRAPARVAFMVQQLEKAGTKIVIPTPVLSELLVRATDQSAQETIDLISKLGVFRVESFDTRAAVELGTMLRREMPTGKKQMKGDGTWAKAKFDRQIVAIAKAVNADAMYSDDGDVRNLCDRAKIPVISIWQLPLPPEDPNLNLFERHTE